MRYHKGPFVVLGIFCLAILANCGIFIAAEILNNSRPEKPISFCAEHDESAPVISIAGGEAKTVIVGSEYDDEGAEVIDDCDDVELSMSGEVDTSKVGTYELIYATADSKGNSASKKRTVHVVPESRGTIYLTFDDGPGPYTAELLDVLKKYDVKATFFVTGSGDDNLILREYQEGHAIGLHTLSHNYSYVYSSIDNFFSDLNAVQERVKRITGEESHLMRFPGGSSNTVSARYDHRTRIMSKLVAEVEARGFTYYDWSINSGDAGQTTDTNVVYERTVNALRDGDNVILQHDIKGFSVAAVERIIEYGLSHGFRFATLSKDSYTAHHGVNN